jgi:hypothetical protein
MKIDAGAILNKISRSTSKPAAATTELTLAAGDKFASRPHADYDTNLARLREASLRNPGQVEESRSDYSEPISNQDVDQTGFQERLIADLGPQFARMQYTHDCSKLQGMIPTASQLQAEFNKLAANKDVPFEYIKDGCYARAHIMCDQMNQDNINNSKMFCMLENPYGAGKLTAENKYMTAKWWYHVAPMVFAVDEQSKQVEPFIMDPSMSNKPMKPQEWIHAMWDEKTRIKVDVTRNPQYGPLEASHGANETFEESMPSAIETCAEYTVEMEQIKQDYDATHPPQSQRKAA